MRLLCLLALLVLAACGGGSGSPPSPVVATPPPVTIPPPPASPSAPMVSVDIGIKTIVFTWAEISDATHYRLFENADGHSGFSQLGPDIPAGSTSVSIEISVHRHDFVNALYMLDACNAGGCSGSVEVNMMNQSVNAIGYLKAPDTLASDLFGQSIAMSADGNTLAVGSRFREARRFGPGGNPANNNSDRAGAVYVFRLGNAGWFQQAHILPTDSESDDRFGSAIALSGDGNTLVVGAPFEDSGATGVDGDQFDNSSVDSGAVYIFEFDGSDWIQAHYIKAILPAMMYDDLEDNEFGSSVALDASGNVLAIGAPAESSDGYGVNPCPCIYWAQYHGAVYVLERSGSSWEHSALMKGGAYEDSGFGTALALSGDGSTLAAGAPGSDYEVEHAYIYRDDGSGWVEEAVFDGDDVRNTGDDRNDEFGASISLDASGTTVAIGAPGDSSNSTEINGDRNDDSRESAGAVHLLRYDGSDWTQQAYLKPSTVSGGRRLQFAEAIFGRAVSLSASGDYLAVGADGQNSGDAGVNADQDDHSAEFAGAVFLFDFDGTDWTRGKFIKASNPDEHDLFGAAVQLSADGATLAVGAALEDSAGTGIGSDQSDNSAADSGAVYVY